MSYPDIPRSKFERAPRPADGGDTIRHASIGYFADAMRRFTKNRAAITAAVLILAVVLFSLLTPLIIGDRTPASLDAYYAKKPPRLTRGGTREEFTERGMIATLAIGAGASAQDGTSVPFSEINEEYDPVRGEIKRDGNTFIARIDRYLEVGFVYMQISGEEMSNIREFERESGRTVLYPLVAQNEFSADASNANLWYKTDRRLNPVDEGGERIPYSEDMTLSENYMRSEDGTPVYAVSSGGEDEYRVRVLYYNHYIYKNGFAPRYVLGTDAQGYDLALRLAGGIRLSLGIAVCVSLINLLLGAAYGAISGYYGGGTDTLMQRLTEILSGVPFIVVATLFQIHLAKKVGPIPSLLFAFVLTGWIPTAGRVRAQFYRYKNQEYVLAARTLGASDARIILRHIFPNALGTLITSSVLIIPSVIFSESMLSFLGIVNLGGASATSLGALLSEAAGIWTSYPHLMLFPAAVISVLMVSFNLFGNGLRDALDPSARE
ncbi:MAG: ABC transporter permease [Clostridia bacterium]|nr:ABC transporter permease [Clostridia bacterium]